MSIKCEVGGCSWTRPSSCSRYQPLLDAITMELMPTGEKRAHMLPFSTGLAGTRCLMIETT
eukprot:244599-Amphidinium_carterae.1